MTAAVAMQAAERVAPAEQEQVHETSTSSSQASEERLSMYSPDTRTVQLVVAGAGPSGLAVAERVSQSGNHGLCTLVAVCVLMKVYVILSLGIISFIIPMPQSDQRNHFQRSTLQVLMSSQDENLKALRRTQDKVTLHIYNGQSFYYLLSPHKAAKADPGCKSSTRVKLVWSDKQWEVNAIPSWS